MTPSRPGAASTLCVLTPQVRPWPLSMSLMSLMSLMSCPRPAAGDGGGVWPGGAPWHPRRQTSADTAPALGGGEMCQTLSPRNSSHVRWENKSQSCPHKSWKLNVIDDNQHLNALEVLQIYFLIRSISWCMSWEFPFKFCLSSLNISKLLSVNIEIWNSI